MASVDQEVCSNVGGEIVLLDYGAGNVQSVVNAIERVGCTVRYVEKPEDITNASRLIFPGVGAFGACVARLKELNYFEPLKQYLRDDRPFFGICLGMQTLFEASEETPGAEGLGILPGTVRRFPTELGLAVPNIGWNGVAPLAQDPWPLTMPQPRCYFVHSFHVPFTDAPWALAASQYGSPYICAVRSGNIVATQFHPEKSGSVGLNLLGRWLLGGGPSAEVASLRLNCPPPPMEPAKRIIACLDVRSNDQGHLVVTKGDQYDVREAGDDRGVRNLGKPVELCERYYDERADEVTFLNITAFRESTLADQPMLAVLKAAGSRVFVPLTVGGGIRGYVDGEGRIYTALEVADAYFRAGADKVSIGTDAVDVARAWLAAGRQATGETSIETISTKYGRQAVVISVDPRRMYVANPADADGHACVEMGTRDGAPLGANGEKYAWYCCTVRGGRENSELDVVQLVQAMEALGAGEILLNCIDRDGQGNGYELELVRQVKGACSMPVIASSGAGCPEHMAEALRPPAEGGGGANAALAAGIFHRREVPIESVKAHLQEQKISVRQ